MVALIEYLLFIYTDKKKSSCKFDIVSLSNRKGIRIDAWQWEAYKTLVISA